MHRILARQIKKCGLDADLRSSTPESLLKLVNLVSEHYYKQEEDRELILHAIAETDKDIEAKAREIFEINSKMLQSAKLASLGTMAAGIAHELNNPLAYIKGYAELLLNYETEPSKSEKLDRIKSGCQRMQQIISHLKKLAHGQVGAENARFVLQDAFDGALTILDHRLRQQCITVDLEGDTALILVGDQYNFESVLQNLIVNSCDAFLGISSHSQPRITIKCLHRLDQNNLTIFYRDNAGGIPKEIINNIFDPFFTTKDVGKGVGLGLSLSKQIIADMKGSLMVQSDHKTFTEFSLVMRIAAMDSNIPLQNDGDTKHNQWIVEPITNPQSAQINHVANKKHILIVDDEPEICNVLRECLNAKYALTITIDPQVALKKLSNERFDLVLTDLSMPIVSGLQIAKECQRLEIDVVVMSGNHDASTQELIQQGFIGVIKKPFLSLSDLSDTIASYLGTGG